MGICSALGTNYIEKAREMETPLRLFADPIQWIKMPPIETAADIVSALGKVADAVAAGDVTPDEGSAVANVLEVKRRSIETANLEGRIQALEARK
jgi:hypothetical protein